MSLLSRSRRLPPPTPPVLELDDIQGNTVNYTRLTDATGLYVFAYRDQARTYYAAAEDGDLSDEDCRQIALATRRFFARLEAVRALFAADLERKT